MRIRLLIFTRSSAQASPRILFGVREGSFTHELEFSTLDEAATALGVVRHTAFDWAVGDAGSRCALVELPSQQDPSALGTLGPLAWLSFQEAARSLADGNDRRYLQLAVQYISQGGVDDSVIASDYDMDLLQTLRKEIERKAEDRT